MGASTAIAWTRSSWSPWIGCTRISQGCDHCYAEALDKRHRYGGKTNWGAGVARHRTGAAYWERPLAWNRIAGMERKTGSCVDGSGRRGKSAMGIQNGWTMPGFWPVFPSLCDPFDNEVPEAWRNDFWNLIYNTPHLTWLLLTKRIGNVAKMLPGLMNDHYVITNVWIGASIVNQEEADRDIPKLLAVTGVAKRFVSYEPALGPIDFSAFMPKPMYHCPVCGKEKMRSYCAKCGTEDNTATNQIIGIDQIIVGGESNQGGGKARPFDIEWARSTVRQCKAAGVACFVKQMGSNTIFTQCGEPYLHINHKDRAGADPAEWPEDLRIQQFPTSKEAAWQ